VGRSNAAATASTLSRGCSAAEGIAQDRKRVGIRLWRNSTPFGATSTAWAVQTGEEMKDGRCARLRGVSRLRLLY
jgi:hypothetical protein